MYPGRKLRQYPRGCGNTAIAAPVPEHWREPILELTRDIFGDVGYQGLGSIEYKVRPDESLAIMEPTVGRTNWQSEVAVLNGVDIPAIAYFDLAGRRWSGQAAEPDTSYKLVDARADLRELKRIFKPEGLGLGQWLKDRRGRKRYMRWRAGDPAPTFAAIGHFLFRALRFGLRLPVRVSRRLFATTANSG